MPFTQTGGQSLVARQPFYPARCGTGIRFFKMRLPVSTQLLFLHLPAIRRHVAWRERVATIRAAQVLIDSGLSHNAAAPLIGMSQGTLSKWMRRLEAFGEEGLLENRADTLAATKRLASGIAVKMIFQKQ